MAVDLVGILSCTVAVEGWQETDEEVSTFIEHFGKDLYLHQFLSQNNIMPPKVYWV